MVGRSVGDEDKVEGEQSRSSASAQELYASCRRHALWQVMHINAILIIPSSQ